MNLVLIAAQAAALVQPVEPVFGWREGAVYAVATRPGHVTDIALEPGERLSAEGAVAAGDTARWIIGQSQSGAGATLRSHVLVKPVDALLETNLVIATDRRVYHLELRASDQRYDAAVSWRYPNGELIALKAPPAASAAVETPSGRSTDASPIAADTDIVRLNFAYKLDGEAPWRPLRVFDDGRRTVIDFPPAASELPPLFLLNGRRDAAELVNYRVVGRRVVIDRLVDAAELRLGAGERQRVVRITREAPSR